MNEQELLTNCLLGFVAYHFYPIAALKSKDAPPPLVCFSKVSAANRHDQLHFIAIQETKPTLGKDESLGIALGDLKAIFII